MLLNVHITLQLHTGVDLLELIELPVQDCLHIVPDPVSVASSLPNIINYMKEVLISLTLISQVNRHLFTCSFNEQSEVVTRRGQDPNVIQS